jgi:hypothetical protein
MRLAPLSGHTERQHQADGVVDQNAEKPLEVAVIAHSRIIGILACSTTQVIATAKKPDRRRLATTIVMPSSKVIVSRSMVL